MTEQLISFETAKLAKEKGFDIECNTFYNSGSQYNLQNDSLIRTGNNIIIEAPTQALLAQWLRSKGINIFIFPSFRCYTLHHLSKFDELNERNEDIYLKGLEFRDFKTYEHALEEGLQQALKLI